MRPAPRQWHDAVAGEAPSLAVNSQPAEEECFDSWLAHLCGLLDVTRRELFGFLGLPPAWGNWDLVSAPKLQQVGALEPIAERLAAASGAPVNRLYKSFLPVAPSLLLPRYARRFSCRACVTAMEDRGHRVYRRRTWYLRQTWVCSEHGQVLEPLWAGWEGAQISRKRRNSTWSRRPLADDFVAAFSILEAAALRGCLTPDAGLKSSYADGAITNMFHKKPAQRIMAFAKFARRWAYDGMPVWQGDYPTAIIKAFEAGPPLPQLVAKLRVLSVQFEQGAPSTTSTIARDGRWSSERRGPPVDPAFLRMKRVRLMAVVRRLDAASSVIIDPRRQRLQTADAALARISARRALVERLAYETAAVNDRQQTLCAALTAAVQYAEDAALIVSGWPLRGADERHQLLVKMRASANPDETHQAARALLSNVAATMPSIGRGAMALLVIPKRADPNSFQRQSRLA